MPNSKAVSTKLIKEALVHLSSETVKPFDPVRLEPSAVNRARMVFGVAKRKRNCCKVPWESLSSHDGWSSVIVEYDSAPKMFSYGAAKPCLTTGLNSIAGLASTELRTEVTVSDQVKSTSSCSAIRPTLVELVSPRPLPGFHPITVEQFVKPERCLLHQYIGCPRPAHVGLSPQRELCQTNVLKSPVGCPASASRGPSHLAERRATAEPGVKKTCQCRYKFAVCAEPSHQKMYRSGVYVAAPLSLSSLLLVCSLLPLLALPQPDLLSAVIAMERLSVLQDDVVVDPAPVSARPHLKASLQSLSNQTGGLVSSNASVDSITVTLQSLLDYIATLVTKVAEPTDWLKRSGFGYYAAYYSALGPAVSAHAASTATAHSQPTATAGNPGLSGPGLSGAGLCRQGPGSVVPAEGGSGHAPALSPFTGYFLSAGVCEDWRVEARLLLERRLTVTSDILAYCLRRQERERRRGGPRQNVNAYLLSAPEEAAAPKAGSKSVGAKALGAKALALGVYGFLDRFAHCFELDAATRSGMGSGGRLFADHKNVAAFAPNVSTDLLCCTGFESACRWTPGKWSLEGGLGFSLPTSLVVASANKHPRKFQVNWHVLEEYLLWRCVTEQQPRLALKDVASLLPLVMPLLPWTDLAGAVDTSPALPLVPAIGTTPPVHTAPASLSGRAVEEICDALCAVNWDLVCHTLVFRTGLFNQARSRNACLAKFLSIALDGIYSINPPEPDTAAATVATHASPNVAGRDPAGRDPAGTDPDGRNDLGGGNGTGVGGVGNAADEAVLAQPWFELTSNATVPAEFVELARRRKRLAGCRPGPARKREPAAAERITPAPLDELTLPAPAAGPWKPLEPEHVVVDSGGRLSSERSEVTVLSPVTATSAPYVSDEQMAVSEQSALSEVASSEVDAALVHYRVVEERGRAPVVVPGARVRRGAEELGALWRGLKISYAGTRVGALTNALVKLRDWFESGGGFVSSLAWLALGDERGGSTGLDFEEVSVPAAWASLGEAALETELAAAVEDAVLLCEALALRRLNVLVRVAQDGCDKNKYRSFEAVAADRHLRQHLQSGLTHTAAGRGFLRAFKYFLSNNPRLVNAQKNATYDAQVAHTLAANFGRLVIPPRAYFETFVFYTDHNGRTAGAPRTGAGANMVEASGAPRPRLYLELLDKYCRDACPQGPLFMLLGTTLDLKPELEAILWRLLLVLRQSLHTSPKLPEKATDQQLLKTVMTHLLLNTRIQRKLPELISTLPPIQFTSAVAKRPAPAPTWRPPPQSVPWQYQARQQFAPVWGNPPPPAAYYGRPPMQQPAGYNYFAYSPTGPWPPTTYPPNSAHPPGPPKRPP
ncbi:hypothetical protein GNI_130970 [Gregarina niphandrodes]|uniref:Uncharacterized protein n=1 Tax=Gregarina niphandrodes TaxID=110365 RepID=A0A023B1E8_GRENI|nr:hypothetical protein GNI_130970 [Gregarina niphandrodes]EZG47614.1 hypothetical protein GNI_130970 [Gregarina niphandrodes]|eukprot:XP_011132164.1 hypothetical protein GNI_130970 [Gregarina niphandrodes]